MTQKPLWVSISLYDVARFWAQAKREHIHTFPMPAYPDKENLTSGGFYVGHKRKE